jgi:hypothetical protein
MEANAEYTGRKQHLPKNNSKAATQLCSGVSPFMIPDSTCDTCGLAIHSPAPAAFGGRKALEAQGQPKPNLK